MMSEFIQNFRAKGDLSFLGMRNIADELLIKDKNQRNKIYENLKRGTEVILDENLLNMYLFSFGKMHKAKLDEAFLSIQNKICELSEQEVEIYDWGCGQGTATICFLDYLKKNNITYKKIVSLNLIEPSELAIKRAKEVIEIINSDYKVKIINKDFNELMLCDFEKSNNIKIHLFSNILDVEDIDLVKFTHLFQQSFNADNLFICVGPYYINSRRISDFITAINPDSIFAQMDKGKGEWEREWTISLRIFGKKFQKIESIADIRKRVEDSHKKDQFFAGYILDAVSEEYQKFGTDEKRSQEIEELYRSLSVFDVKSDIQIGVYDDVDPKLSVLANIISRGLPTKAPIYLEEVFKKIFDLSEKNEDGGTISYRSKSRISAEQIYDALHIIEPRFNFENHYNKELLGSNFEKDFIKKIKDDDRVFLAQVLEPRRPLSSLVTLPKKEYNFYREKWVNFAIEIPYGGYSGFIVEIDCEPYHREIFQRLRDTSQSGWKIYSIGSIDSDESFDGWMNDEKTKPYLDILHRNYHKTLTGEWNKTLQIVLSPLAIARVERILVEALMVNSLDISKKEWNIVILERDVPCAAIAIKVFQDKIKHIWELAGCEDKVIPTINLCIVSTKEFRTSPLHLGQKVYLEIPKKYFDLCLDISMLLRDNIEILPIKKLRKGTTYIIRSSHYEKRKRTIYTSECIQYPPLVIKNSVGEYENIKDREDIITYFLQDIFRKTSFRTGQLPIISRSLEYQTTIGLLPTGGGKSLTYQIACILQPGVAIVVDPLVALMEDQVQGLRKLRIDNCDRVNSLMKRAEKLEKLNLLQNGAVLFMFLSPERFMMQSFRENLATMTDEHNIYFSYGIIDEVHCVSEWGHDFRTSYLHLGRNMRNFMKVKSKGRSLSIIGLTATASFDVLADVERELNLDNIHSEGIIRSEDDKRKELTYRVVKVVANFDHLREKDKPYLLDRKVNEWKLKEAVTKAKMLRMDSLFGEIPATIAEKNAENRENSISNYSEEKFFVADKNGKYPYAGIIFCPHAKGNLGVNNSSYRNKITNEQKVTHGIYTQLLCRENGLQLCKFVGGDNPEEDMASFNNNDKNLMVATKAFGMGIDKPNIRYTINFNHPSSIESYVQEAGRGGRDKRNAISYVLYEATEYICLTEYKIQKIRALMSPDDPVWLKNYSDRYVLFNDFSKFCESNGASKSQIDEIISICRKNGYWENVDKNVPLWFHNNSFKGVLKEKVILYEMTDRILNVKPNRVKEIQGKLQDITGNEDICLKVDEKKNALKILSKDKKQYGYLFLSNLYPYYKCKDFDEELCKYVVEELIGILKTYEDYSAQSLSKPLDMGVGDLEQGIYKAMESIEKGGVVYVNVSWENQIKQDLRKFERDIKTEITKIAQTKVWNDIRNPENFKLDKIGDFKELLGKIQKASDDNRWSHFDTETDSRLKRLFCKKRDKSDTEKAIYRLCCIGLVEDVTVDYLSETYELKIRKHSDDEYKNRMLEFFCKYYSEELAEKKVSEIYAQKGRNYLDKCLGYLTEFVYDSLEKKRYRAIDDMRIACEESISEREKTGNDDWLKEFIHLYFNSKYARNGYEINGESYSLMEDVDENKREDFEVVKKYIKAVSEDASGSEIDNVKHLYGATLLCIRAHPENVALKLLLTYCLTFLGVGQNDKLKTDVYNSYFDGFIDLYENMVMDKEQWLGNFEYFNEQLKSKVKDDYIREEILSNKGKQTIIFLIYVKKFDEFAIKYVK